MPREKRATGNTEAAASRARAPFRFAGIVQARFAAVVNLPLANCVASCGLGRFAMFSSRDAFENDFCPVRDDLLGAMYRANENGLPQLVESVSADVRAMLALFCYKRSHLHSLALAIAASCNERDLFHWAAASAPRSTRYRAKPRPRAQHLPRPTATASRSRCRPSRSLPSRRSTTNWTTKILRRL